MTVRERLATDRLQTLIDGEFIKLIRFTLLDGNRTLRAIAQTGTKAIT